MKEVKEEAAAKDNAAASLLNPIFQKVQIPNALRSPRVGISIAIISVAIALNGSSDLISCHWNGVRCIPSNSATASCMIDKSQVSKSGSKACIAVPVVQDAASVDPDKEKADVMPMMLAMVFSALIPLWMKVKDTDKNVAGFAAFEFFSCAVGNGLLAATSMVAGYYEASEEVSGLAVQVVLWILFALLYFPTGGHMNAALTAGAWACGQITLAAAVLYIIAQTAGCVFAMECVRLLAPNHLQEHFAPPTPPYLESGIWAAGLWELVCTVMLILASLGCDLFDKYYIVASTIIVVLVRFTGAGMDPLGAICGAWFAGDYSNQLEVYWVASIAGGLIAGIIWKRWEQNGILEHVSFDKLWIKVTKKDREMIGFATFEFFSCALGNGLLTTTVIISGTYGASDDMSDLAFQAMLWMLFAWLYFPTGGHMNAALTAGAWACGQITLAAAVLYIIAQTAGCVFAMECIRLIAPNHLHEHFGAPIPPYTELGLWAAGAYELVCTVLLILVSLGCDLFDSGYVVASTLIVVLVRFTGASMDPLGAICGAWFAGDYSHQMEIFWGASIFGGLIAGFIWKKCEAIHAAGGKLTVTNKETTGFAVFEFFSCALGNGLLTTTVLIAKHYQASDETSDLAFQAMLWMLFALLYFPTGGHMNAALTAGAWAAGQCTFGAAVLYIIAQTVGCVFSMEFVRFIAPDHLHEHFGPAIPPYMESGLWTAGAYELVCTVLLILVSLGCDLFDTHYIIASTLIVVLVRFTGASMDPLGAICGAWFAGDYSHQMEVYWGASLFGGLIAGFIWKKYESRQVKQKKD